MALPIEGKSKNTATLIGLIAILLWSSLVGLIRGVTESLGPTGGAAMIYTVAAALLFFTIGFTKPGEFPRRYLFWGSILFVSYEVFFALAIAYSHNGQQAIEIGMVNYLWPTFTVVAAILFNHQKSNILIIPGFIMSLFGIGLVLGGEQGLDPSVMAGNVKDNPLSYALAFSGALIWAAYCIVTARSADGKNGITLFFILTALALWAQYFATGGEAMTFSPHALIMLVCTAAAMGFGYAAWNVGILRGNVTILAGASYFTPVFSALLASAILQTPLALSFWQGATMVCAGSIVCWLATRTKRPASLS